MTLDLFSPSRLGCRDPAPSCDSRARVGRLRGALGATGKLGSSRSRRRSAPTQAQFRPTSFPDRRSRSTRGRGSQRSGRQALSTSAFASTARPDYPARLRDADHPVGLLYFQGNWELVNTRCVAVISEHESPLLRASFERQSSPGCWSRTGLL